MPGLLRGRAIGLLFASITVLGARADVVRAGDSVASIPPQLVAILAELERVKQSWPAATTEAVRAAIATGDERRLHAALAEQVLLDVTISPEGRVKLDRGPATTAMVQKRPRLFLVKIDNQTGGQQRLEVIATYTGDTRNPFVISIAHTGRYGPDLTGLPIEYRLLRITDAKAGRHELTIVLEAGQGSQDLGFRAEVPVLFTVEAAP